MRTGFHSERRGPRKQNHVATRSTGDPTITVLRPPASAVLDAAEPAPVSWDLAVARKSADKTDPGHETRLELFEEIVLPHLNAAHNLARWLTRNDEDAQDVVQESYLRAFRFFDSYKGADAKSWLLAIVRNTCRTWQKLNWDNKAVPFDEAMHSESQAPLQEKSMTERERAGALRSCIERLPADFREVLLLREFEEMSYREIAEVTGLAIGTVMSRLSRARKRLEECAGGTIEGAG